MKSKTSVYSLCFVAFAIVLNIAGAQLALLLHLPIFLDSIGTCFAAAALGAFYGMLPSLFSSIIVGMMGDAYAFYYAPVGILLGFLCAIAWKYFTKSKGQLFLTALFISLPTSILSACITAYLFGGITSSGSTIIVQLLAQTPIGLTLSCFIVQFISDYADRLITLFIVKKLIHRVPIRHK